MIHIDRTAFPIFEQFVSSNCCTDWKSFSVKAHDTVYVPCVDELTRQQQGISAYTEMQIGTSGPRHIDHFRKQSLYNSKRYVFGWENYVVANHDNNFGAERG